MGMNFTLCSERKNNSRTDFSHVTIIMYIILGHGLCSILAMQNPHLFEGFRESAEELHRANGNAPRRVGADIFPSVCFSDIRRRKSNMRILYMIMNSIEPPEMAFRRPLRAYNGQDFTDGGYERPYKLALDAIVRSPIQYLWNRNAESVII